MSARVYFMKKVNDGKDVSIMIHKMNSEDGHVFNLCEETISRTISRAHPTRWTKPVGSVK